MEGSWAGGDVALDGGWGDALFILQQSGVVPIVAAVVFEA
jgi:hypothetical protein